MAFERGRAFLLSEAIEQSRIDLDQLESAGRADLAERYRAVSRASGRRAACSQPKRLEIAKSPVGAEPSRLPRRTPVRQEAHERKETRERREGPEQPGNLVAEDSPA